MLAVRVVRLVYLTLYATGTASALAFGRLGAILSSFAGGQSSRRAVHAYLTPRSAMVVTLVAMLIMRRHIPRVETVSVVPPRRSPRTELERVMPTCEPSSSAARPNAAH